MNLFILFFYLTKINLNLFIFFNQNKTTINMSFFNPNSMEWKEGVANSIGQFPQELFWASHKRGRIFSLKGVSVDSSAVAVAPCVRLGTRCNLRQILDSEWNRSQQVTRFWYGFLLSLWALENHFVSGRLCRIDIRWSFYSLLFMLPMDPHLGLRWSNNKHWRAFSMSMDEMPNAMANCLLPSS